MPVVKNLAAESRIMRCRRPREQPARRLAGTPVCLGRRLRARLLTVPVLSTGRSTLWAVAILAAAGYQYVIARQLTVPGTLPFWGYPACHIAR